MQSLLLMRAAQSLSFALKRRACRNNRNKQVHAALEEQAQDDERARCGFCVDAVDDVEGEDDDEVHEGEADQ